MIETIALRAGTVPPKRTSRNEEPRPAPAPADFFDPNIDQPREAFKLPIMQPEVQLMLGSALLGSMMGGLPLIASATVDVQTGERHSHFEYQLTPKSQQILSGGGLVDEAAHTSTRATLLQDDFNVRWEDNFKPRGSDLSFEMVEGGFKLSGQVGQIEVDLDLKQTGPGGLVSEGTVGGVPYSVATTFTPQHVDEHGMTGVVATRGSLGNEQIARQGIMHQGRDGTSFEVAGEFGAVSQRVKAELTVKD